MGYSRVKQGYKKRIKIKPFERYLTTWIMFIGVLFLCLTVFIMFKLTNLFSWSIACGGGGIIIFLNYLFEKRNNCLEITLYKDYVQFTYADGIKRRIYYDTIREIGYVGMISQLLWAKISDKDDRIIIIDAIVPRMKLQFVKSLRDKGIPVYMGREAWTMWRKIYREVFIKRKINAYRLKSGKRQRFR